MSDVLPSAWEGLAMQVVQRGGLVPWNFKAAGGTLSTMNSRSMLVLCRLKRTVLFEATW